MSVPPELIQQMMAGMGGAGGPSATAGAPVAGAPGAGPAAPAAKPPAPSIGGAQGGPPGAAPLSSPQQKPGLHAAALTNLHIAVNMLEEALPAFGSESEQGRDILKCLSTLSKHVARKDNSDLVPAEVMQMVSQLPQMGGGTQMQQQILQQMRQQRAATQPAAGGAPGGMPPRPM